MTFQVALLYIDSVFVFSANFPSTFTLKMTFLVNRYLKLLSLFGIISNTKVDP